MPKSFSIKILVPVILWVLAIVLATASLVMHENERSNTTYIKAEKIIFVALPHLALISLSRKFANHIAKSINSILYNNDVIQMRFSKIFGHVIIS